LKGAGFRAEEFDDQQPPELTDRATVGGFGAGIGTPVTVRSNRWSASVEQITAKLQFTPAVAIGQEAELANTNQARGKYVGLAWPSKI